MLEGNSLLLQGLQSIETNQKFNLRVVPIENSL